MSAGSGEPPMRISVIVVTLDRRDELSETLTGLRKQDADFELVIVDNGSSDGSPAVARELWPEAVLVELDHNTGVGGGRNHGIHAASGDVLVFLDDDASFERDDTLTRIRRRLIDEPDVGCVATIPVTPLDGEIISQAIPRRDKRIPDHDIELSYFVGVGFALRASILRETGIFDDDFFYACEELDLSWRILDRGYRIVGARDLLTVHRVSKTTRPSGRRLHFDARNRVLLALKWLPWPSVVSYVLTWWPSLLVRGVWHGHVDGVLRGFADCLRAIPRVLRSRRPLRRETVRRIHRLSGRVWY